MHSLKFNPLGTSGLSKRRAIRQPSVSCTGHSAGHSGTRAALQDLRLLPSPKTILTAAAGLSTVLLANPALADLDHSSVVNTAQQFGVAGVAMVTASAATYGGILLMQHMLKGFGGQQRQHQPHYSPRSTSYARREGGNVPAFAFGGPSGTPSPTTLSFQQAPSKPLASPAAVPAPAHTRPAAKSKPSSKPSNIPEVSPATPNASSASHELLASMDTTPEPAAPHHDDSLFTAARGKSLQAIFRHGSGCSGHSRAAIDFVSNLLSPIAEPASGSENALAASATQLQSLPEKAPESVPEFTAAAEAAGELLEAAEKESMTVRSLVHAGSGFVWAYSTHMWQAQFQADLVIADIMALVMLRLILTATSKRLYQNS